MPPSLTDSLVVNYDCEAEVAPLLNGNRTKPTRREEITDLTEAAPPSLTRWVFIKGVLLSTLSGMLFTANNFIIKEFKVVPTDAILVRGVVQVIFLSFYALLRSYQLFPDTKRKLCLVLVQGMCGGFSFISALLSVSRMPVADALVVMFSDPLVTMVGATIFLGEKINLLRMSTGVSIIAGVVLVCKPPFLFSALPSKEVLTASTPQIEGHDSTYWVGAAFAMAAVLTGVFHNLVVPCCKEIESVVLVVWVGLSAIIISLVVSQFDQSAKIAVGKILDVEPEMWALFFGLAASGMAAYVCLTKSLQLISPSLVASLRSLEIVFAYFVEAIIFSVVPTPLSILGAAFVILGVSGIAFEENILGLVRQGAGSISECWRNRRTGYQQI